MFFIADLTACSTCFGHHYAHHQELESIIQFVAACGLWFSSCRYGVELRVVCPVCGLHLCKRLYSTSDESRLLCIKLIIEAKHITNLIKRRRMMWMDKELTRN
jgi:hypothetical protein